MKNRCYYPKDKEYKNYGGRGIKVCDEWLGEFGFEKFYQWSLANGFQPNLSLDRIDVDGDYEPSNCRWITCKEQAINRRTTHFIMYKGEVHSVSDWAKILGINRSTLSKRINEYGMSLEKAMMCDNFSKHRYQPLESEE